MDKILQNVHDDDKWASAPFGKIRVIPNTKVGDVGQAFVQRICDEISFGYKFPTNSKGEVSRINDWDINIKGTTFELKTATEDVNGSFQFNHIRYHRNYDALLCVGIGPDYIVTEAWTKAEVSTKKAGNLVSMDKGSSATWKLTKRKDELRPICDIKDVLSRIIGG